MSNRLKLRVLPRVPGRIVAGANTTVTQSNGVWTISSTGGELADAEGYSVLGRSGGTTGTPTSISAAADGQILRRSGTAVAFGVASAEFVKFTQSGIGAVERSLSEKAKDVKHPKEYGAVGDGVTNDTLALQRFLTALRDGGRGEWNGTYLVNRGTLLLQPTSTTADTNGPTITGDAKFITTGGVDSPVLRIWNAADGFLYKRGSLGGIEIEEGGTAVTNGHGLSIRGAPGWKIASYNADGLYGSGIHYPFDSDNDGNETYYADIGFLDIQNCLGHGILDEIGYGASGLFRAVSMTSNDGGGIKVAGSGNRFPDISMSGVPGWNIHQYYLQNTPSRNTYENSEIDCGGEATTKGFWLENATASHLYRCRFIVRPVNQAQQALRLGNATDGSANVSNCTIDLTLRISPGCTVGAATALVNLTNEANISSTVLNITVEDNTVGQVFIAAGPSSIVKNIHASAQVKIVVNGVVYHDTLPKNLCRVIANGSTRVNAAGVLTKRGTVSGDTGAQTAATGLDPLSMWDNTNKWIVLEANGTYRVSAMGSYPVATTTGAGLVDQDTLIEITITRDRASVLTVLGETRVTSKAYSGGYQTVHVPPVLFTAQAGDRIYVSERVTGTAPVLLTGSNFNGFLEVEMI